MTVMPGVAEKVRRGTKVPRIDDEMIYLVGLIVIHWAHLEADLADLVSAAADVDYPIARLAFKDRPAEERVALAEELLQVRNFDPPPKLKALRAPLRAASQGRNKVAHSTWVQWPVRGSKETEL